MSSVKVKLDLSRFRRNFKEAQKTLAEQVMVDCKTILPSPEGGSLAQRSYVSKDNMQVVFPGPYAHYLYIGLKMVNRETGKGPFLAHDKYGNEIGLRYKKGTKLKYADPEVDLKFTRPEAEKKWFEVAKTNHLKDWQKLVNDEMKKR